MNQSTDLVTISQVFSLLTALNICQIKARSVWRFPRYTLPYYLFLFSEPPPLFKFLEGDPSTIIRPLHYLAALESTQNCWKCLFAYWRWLGLILQLVHCRPTGLRNVINKLTACTSTHNTHVTSRVASEDWESSLFTYISWQRGAEESTHFYKKTTYSAKLYTG